LLPRMRRHSIRLQGYDYTQPGAYFVTICAYQRELLFGEIGNQVMRANAAGELVHACWNDMPNYYPNLDLDAFVLMPNHVHGILILRDMGVGNENVRGETVGVDLRSTPTHIPTESRKVRGLPEMVRAFKAFSTRRINEHRDTPGAPLWQRNYYEHVIRSEKSLNAIRQYIQWNVIRWDIDRENPVNVKR
jgi:putative transposase